MTLVDQFYREVTTTNNFERGCGGTLDDVLQEAGVALTV